MNFDLGSFSLIYLIVLISAIVASILIVIGMKWLYEKRNDRNK